MSGNSIAKKTVNTSGCTVQILLSTSSRKEHMGGNVKKEYSIVGGVVENQVKSFFDKLVENGKG